MKNNGLEQLKTDRETHAISDNMRQNNPEIGESECARKIERSIAYMLQHLNQPLQVATLAATVNISPSHFFVLFKRCAGYPPIDYFIRLRMQRACELLKAGSLHVKEVAAALGYDDPFYFSRVFKSVNRIAPSAYRATHKTLAENSGNRAGIGNFSHAPATNISRRAEYIMATQPSPVFRAIGKYQFA